jgi:glycosyltransferase involved in cell wall biosynthesis
MRRSGEKVTQRKYPIKVLVTGGREIGGVASFAEGLRAGFSELGIPCEIVPPLGIFQRWSELRDTRVLKILSTSAVFAAPFSRRAICMAHGFPCVAHVGKAKTLGILSSLNMATASRGAQLVAVSDYSALQLRTVFGLRVDAVIRNPLHPLFLEPRPETGAARPAITYVGRLISAKNLDAMLPAVLNVLDENPGFCAWIVGDGPLRPRLEKIAHGDSRVEFLGALPRFEVRERLRRSRVFVSGSPTEPLGIVYLEALSQGCAVVMPASGGGLEIAPDEIGGRIQVFGASLAPAEIASAIRRALQIEPKPIQLPAFTASAVAQSYLTVDARFSSRGLFLSEPGAMQPAVPVTWTPHSQPGSSEI